MFCISLLKYYKTTSLLPVTVMTDAEMNGVISASAPTVAFSSMLVVIVLFFTSLSRFIW